MKSKTTTAGNPAHDVALSVQKTSSAVLAPVLTAAASAPPSITDAAHAKWANRINQRLRNGLEAFVEAGNDLIAAKKALGHGGFGAMLKSGLLTIDQRTAERLMRVAGNPALSNSTNWSLLPSSLHSLDVLATLDAPVIEKAISDGELTSCMTIAKTRNLVLLKRGDVPKQPVQPATAPVAESERGASAVNDDQTTTQKIPFSVDEFANALAQFLEAECAKHPRYRAKIRMTATEVCAKFFRRRKESHDGSVQRTHTTEHVDVDKIVCPPTEQPGTSQQQSCAVEKLNGSDTSTASATAGTTSPAFRKKFHLTDEARTQLDSDLSALKAAEPTSSVYADALRRVHKSGNYLAVAGSFDAFCEEVLHLAPADANLILEPVQPTTETPSARPPVVSGQTQPKRCASLKDKIAAAKLALQKSPTVSLHQ